MSAWKNITKPIAAFETHRILDWLMATDGREARQGRYWDRPRDGERNTHP